MARRNPVFFSLALILFLAVALTPTSAGEGTAAKGLFWEVRSGQATMYLLGAVHFLPTAVYPLPAKIEEAFTRAEKLIVELDAQKRMAEIQTLTLRYGLFPPGDSLSRHLDADTYETVKKKAAEYGLDMAVVDSFRPWLVATVLISLEFEKAGYQADRGLDLYFLKKAAGQKEVLELETPVFQVELLASLDRLILRDSLRDMEKAGEIIKDFTTAWTEGKEETVEALTYQELGNPELAGFYQDFYFKRNKAWADRLAALLQGKGVYFVVVGAGHLVGPRGVVALLEEKGFKVNRL